ncbi:unnamed protein product [Thlaspi arvense]|uniref:Auxin-responsive protein n=1 Tax=Thlaspi arvense TaxID=13288 RepID=A0AAU9RJG2_THLAR|nr:unnamed protein product [Thlaspi arvense]
MVLWRRQCRADVAGWPPVRSYRKKALGSRRYVKVAIDGAPYLRKVDLEAYGNYQELLRALEEMSTCFFNHGKVCFFSCQSHAFSTICLPFRNCIFDDKENANCCRKCYQK